MEKHLSYFNNFKKRLQDGKVVGIETQNEEIIVQIKTNEEEFNLILIATQNDGELKLDGMGID